MKEEGAGAGGEFEQEAGAPRLANLVNKGPLFDGLYTNPIRRLESAYNNLFNHIDILNIN